MSDNSEFGGGEEEGQGGETKQKVGVDLKKRFWEFGDGEQVGQDGEIRKRKVGCC